LCNKSFWEKEGLAPLLKKNRGFLKEQESNENVLVEASKWSSLVGLDVDPLASFSELNLNDKKPERIFKKDAERTFATAENQQLLTNLLTSLHSKIGNYHQGLSFVASFLMLTLDPPTVFRIIIRLNDDPRYIPGYWHEESVACATDAYVFDYLMKEHFPDVWSHLYNQQILPETYVQKWFIGLGIHVLPYEALFPFFDSFLSEGFCFLFQFGLSLVNTLQKQLLSARTPDRLYALLRLEDRNAENLALTMVHEAHKINLEHYDFQDLRKELYEVKLSKRMQHAAEQRKCQVRVENGIEGKTQKAMNGNEKEPPTEKNLVDKNHEQIQENESEESEVDDHTNNEEEDDEDSEEGEECALCKENFPDFLCEDCGLLVCELCQKGNGQHQSTHTVKVFEDLTPEELLQTKRKAKEQEDSD